MLSFFTAKIYTEIRKIYLKKNKQKKPWVKSSVFAFIHLFSRIFSECYFSSKGPTIIWTKMTAIFNITLTLS